MIITGRTVFSHGKQRFIRPQVWIRVAIVFFLFLVSEAMAVTNGQGADTAPPTIAEILHRVQQRYGGAAFEADFAQESLMEAMGIADRARGHVYFKAPFQMRWHYQEPEEYMIITDGKTVWIYRPLEKQVMMGRAADYFGDTNFAEFFSEPAKLHHNFTIEKAFPDQENTEDHILRLVPRTSAMNVKEVFLFVSKTTYDITRSDTYNAFGDKTRLQFSNFKVGEGMDESLFHFDIPDGADVLQLDRP